MIAFCEIDFVLLVRFTAKSKKLQFTQTHFFWQKASQSNHVSTLRKRFKLRFIVMVAVGSQFIQGRKGRGVCWQCLHAAASC